MSIDLQTVRNTLETWFRGALGTDIDGDPIPVMWRDEPRRQAPGNVRGILHITPSRSFGVDYVEYDQDPGLAAGEDYVPTVKGQRGITLSLQVESLSARAGQTARFYLERARTKLRAPSTQSTFKGIGLAFQTAERVIDVDAEVDGRVLSKATLDVQCGATAEYTDTDGATSWIDTIELSDNELKNPDGTRVEQDLQFNNETLG
jgi:hypothetical protein